MREALAPTAGIEHAHALLAQPGTMRAVVNANSAPILLRVFLYHPQSSGCQPTRVTCTSDL
jgi:hypothetical protein